jgi:hypothetical protein
VDEGVSVTLAGKHDPDAHPAKIDERRLHRGSPSLPFYQCATR